MAGGESAVHGREHAALRVPLHHSIPPVSASSHVLSVTDSMLCSRIYKAIRAELYQETSIKVHKAALKTLAAVIEAISPAADVRDVGTSSQLALFLAPLIGNCTCDVLLAVV